jgi:hypothetical protein
MLRSVACVWPALALSLSLSPRITRCLNACSSARPPRFSAVPPALARAVGDAVPSARCCPRPLLALSVTLSRARAAGLHPSFQPCSNRSPPCGRCRVAASTVLRADAPLEHPVRARDPAYALLERPRPRLRLRLAPYRSTPCGRSRVAASPVLRIIVPKYSQLNESPLECPSVQVPSRHSREKWTIGRQA